MNDYDAVAPFYDAEHDEFRDDIELYCNLVREGPVLEIGAGTGRIMLPLAASGLEVWGIEPSPGMAELAKLRLSQLGESHVVKSLADVPREVVFSAAVFGLNALWHFPSPEEQEHILAQVRERLAAGALLVIDTSNPLTMSDRDSAGEVRQVFRRPTKGHTLTRYSSSWDDQGDQILSVSLTYEEISPGGSTNRAVADLRLRYLYRWELELLLRLAGYSVEYVCGSYDLDDFEAASPRIIMVARAS